MHRPALLASLTTLGYAAWYLLLCAAFPFGHCRRCHGTGKLYAPTSRKVFRLCPRCEGTGRRVRLGRRVFEYLRGEYRHGNPTHTNPTQTNPTQTNPRTRRYR